MVQQLNKLLLGFIIGVFISAFFNHSEFIFSFNGSEICGKTRIGFKFERDKSTKIVKQHGNFWVLENYVAAEQTFDWTESITLSAPADYRFLDNILELVERWDGPISVALYAPGFDFQATLKTIAFLRVCGSRQVRNLVSFHLFFQLEHLPNLTTGNFQNAYDDLYDCNEPPPYANVKNEDMYKFQNKLVYPINVARNIAKAAAQTYFVFPSDIELYPTRNLIGEFFDLMARNASIFAPSARNVFVLPIFEIQATESVPDNKTVLMEMIKSRKAKVFHSGICLSCHKVPNGDQWLKTNQTDTLDIFAVGKRAQKFQYWEPFYICTKESPIFDERLSWEGQRNKFTQVYSMCLLDYNFMVLNNAFLIHKPGVKKKKEQDVNYSDLVRETSRKIPGIYKNYRQLYGSKIKC